MVLPADSDVHLQASMDMNMDKLEFAAANFGSSYVTMHVTPSNPTQALVYARTEAQPIAMAGSNTLVRARSSQRVPKGMLALAHMQWS